MVDILLLSLVGAALGQQTQTFTIALDAPVAVATPLFGPVREAEWSPAWQPSFLHPQGGAQRPGVVFTTRAEADRSQVWVLTEYDEAAGRVDYVVVDPGLMATEIQIRLTAADAGRSRATVTYRRSALAAEANDLVARLDAQWAAAQGPHWEAAINAALHRAGRP